MFTIICGIIFGNKDQERKKRKAVLEAAKNEVI